MANRVQFQVGYTVDKSGLNEIKTSLQSLQKLTSSDLMNVNKSMDLATANAQLTQIKQTAKEVRDALDRSFNSNLGTLNVSKFSQELKSLNIDKVYSDFNAAGSAGQSAFRKITSQVLTTNMQLKETHSLLDTMATTMSNTIKWGVASSAMNTFTGSVQQAYGYVKSLDGSLNDIRIVTNKSAEDMAEFAVQANKAAKALGQSTTDYTNASLIYYQQGLSDEEVAARTETTLKAANVTGQSTSEVSEELTAVWNGYKVSAEEAETYVDKLAAVAATTASDLEELSTGMSKVASAANSMGVDIDQLTAQLSTIVSVTREAPESVGTALKTIYARLGDLAVDGEDEFGVALGTVSSTMEKMGIEILDEQGNMRDMGTVIEETAAKWDTWTEAQRQAAAVAMAGKRQYNNLIALFDNWDMYTDALETSENAMGTLQDQQDIYMESTAAHLQQLSTQWEDLYDSLLDSDTIIKASDALTGVVKLLTNFVDAIGGGGNTLLTLGSIATNVFSKQIAQGIATTITNFQNAQSNAEKLAGEIELLGQIQNSKAMEDPGIAAIVNAKEELQQYYNLLSPEQINEGNGLVQQLAGAKDLQLQWDANVESVVKYVNKLEEAYDEEGKLISEIQQLDINSADQAMADKAIDIQSDLEKASQDADKITAAVKEYNEAVKEYSNVPISEDDFTPIQDSFSNLIDLAGELSERTDIDSASVERLKKLLSESSQNNMFKYIYGELEEGSSEFIQAERRIQQLEKTVTDATGEIKGNVKQAFQVIEEELNATHSKSEQLNNDVEKAENKIKNFNKNAENTAKVQSIVQMASAIGQTVAAFRNLINIYDIWNNEDLSFGEKVLQIISALSMTAMESAMAFEAFNKSGKVAIATLLGVEASELSVTVAAEAMWSAITGPVGIAIAAIAAVVKVSYELYKAYNADAIAAKEAAETAEALNDAYQDVKSSYDELKSSLEDYQSAKDGLDELIKGTDEWNEAVQSLNEQVLELLNSYPELAQYITNTNGLLELSDEGQQALLEVQNAQVQTAYRSSLMGNIAANNAQNTSDITDFARNTMYEDVNSNINRLSNEEVSKILDAINKHGNAILENSEELAEVTGLTKEQADAALFEENTAALLELSKSVQANTESNEIQAQQIGESLLEEKGYSGTKYEDQLAQLVGNVASEYADEAVNDYKANLFRLETWNPNIQQQYADLKGYTDVKNDVFGNKATYYTEDGESVTISNEVARAALAQAEAQDAAAADIDKYANALSELSQTAEGQEQVVQDAVVNLGTGITDVSNLTASQVDQLSQIDFSSLADDTDTLEALGFGSVEEVEALKEEAVNTWNDNLTDLVDNMSTRVKSAWNRVDTKSLTLEEDKYIASILKQASMSGTLGDTVDAINESIAKYKAGDMDTLVGSLDDLISAANDFSAETYAAVHKIIDSLSTGDTIEADDYQTIYAQLGEDTDKYFTQMLDGTYKLTADAQEFYDTVQNSLINDALDQIDSLSDQNKQLEKIQGYDFDTLSKTANKNEDGVNTYDESVVRQQIELVETLGDKSEETAEKIDKWKRELGSGTFDTVFDLQDLANTVANCSDAFDSLGDTIESNNSEMTQLDLSIAMSYDNMQDLRDAYEAGTISAQAFNTALIALDEVLDTQNLDSEELEDYADYLQEAAKDMDGFNDSMSDIEAKTVAKGIMKMNDAIDTLADNFVDAGDDGDYWIDILKNSTSASEEYAEAMIGTKNAVADLLDVSSDFVSNDFITDHLDDINKAATGDEDAIDGLKAALLDEIVAKIVVDNELEDYDLASEVTYLQSLLDDMGPLEVGTSIDDSDFIKACNEMIASAGLTAEQANALFDSMGFETNFKEEGQPVETKIPEYTTYHQPVVSSTYSLDNGDGTTKEVPVWEETSWTEQTGEHIAQGEAASFAMTTDGSVPNIKSITKKASGSANNYSSSNKGGKTPGKSKKKSSGSSKEKDKMDKLEKDADRYHDINLEIKALTTDFDRLSKSQSKLFGKSLIQNLNDQQKVLEKQKQAYKDKIKLAQTEAKELKTSLAKEGVKFDSDGYISNYEAIMQTKLNHVNNIIAKYGKMSADEQKKYKDTVEKAKEDYEKFKEQIENYDTLISDTIPGLEDDIQDVIDQEIEINITKFNMEIELRLDMKEAEKDWNEFKKKVIDGIKDDDILGNAKANLDEIKSYLNGYNKKTGEYDLENSGTGLIETESTHVTDLANIIKNWDENATDASSNGGYGNNETQAMEDLQTYTTNLMEHMEEIVDLSDEVKESYLDMIDEATEAFDKQTDTYEFIDDLIEHDKNVISLLYGDDAYESMNKYYQKQEANNNKEIDFLKKQADYLWTMYEQETDEDAKEKWLEQWQSVISDLNSAVEDAIQTIIDDYTNTINQVFDELNKKVTNGLGLDYVSDEWDLINQNADQYLDTINGMYEIQKLENKYLKAIDSTDSISAQQKLNSLMSKQISMLEDKEKLTQYDVDRANALYEIALKEIALQEAQQNKSTMRLRRDSQGNYSYQYVSDQDSIAQAQQDLADAQNSLYNLDKDQYQQNLDDIYSAYTDFVDKYTELMSDVTLTDDERRERKVLLEKEYNELINGLTEQNNEIRSNLNESAFQELANLYNTDVSNFTSMSEEEQNELMNSLVPQWNSSVQEMANTFAGKGGLLPTCQEAFTELDKAVEEYKNNLSILETAAETNFDNIKKAQDPVITNAETLVQDSQNLIDKYDAEVKSVGLLVTELDKLKNAYASVTAEAKKAATVAYTTLQTANNDTANTAADDNSGDGDTQVTTEPTTTTDKSKDKTKTEKTTQGNGKVELGDKVTLDSDGKYYASSDGSGKGYSKYAGTKTSLYITKIASGKNYPYHLSTKNTPPTSPANQYQVGWVKKSAISGYDTGGYTGEWGDDGKLAILHQKELVLNKEDTENMLSAIKIVRSMDSILNSISSSMSDRISGLLSSLSSSFGKVGVDNGNNTVEQDVHIEANFPNVNNSNEIEEAFNNLVNIAAQHAFNTQK